MDKIWKDVAGYENLYMVSNHGEVKSLAKRIFVKPKGRQGYHRDGQERLLKPVADKKGYLYVRLYSGGEWESYAVHWLVLTTFTGPCSNGMQCRHFPDRNPANNRADNLSWGTPSQNTLDKEYHGTKRGWKLSEDTKRRSALSRTGLKKSAEARRKSSLALTGRPLSEEHCKKLSEAHMGKKWSKARRESYERSIS